MKVRVIFLASLVALFLLSSPAAAGSGSSTGKVQHYGKPGKHRITGTVVLLDTSPPSFTVKGRRKTLSFTSPLPQGVETGDRVRVFYRVGEDKKVVVTRIKKLNNDIALEGEKKSQVRNR